MSYLPPSHEQFFDLLRTTGKLPPEAARRAAAAYASSGQPLDSVLTELGILREDDLARAFSECLDLPLQSSYDDLSVELIEAVSGSFLEDYALLPTLVNDDCIEIVVADPFDRTPIETLAFHVDRKPVIRIGERSKIRACLRSLNVDVEAPNTFEQMPDSDMSGSESDLDRLRNTAREAPVVRFVTHMIANAVERGATDIHIEPQEDCVRIRERRDGFLNIVETAPRSLFAGIVTRIKIMAQLNIAERRLPQDGRLRSVVRGQNVDMRVSIVPTIHGESIALRVLDRSAVRLDLEALGFDGDARRQLIDMVHTSNGIILLTGPTGSGKTTTLYALLQELSATDTKIFTVEDPIEYRIDGVTQLPINPAIGLDFANALRSVLRQDPDVILVGEIRDRETAEIAVRAALTGHLVLSTIHTNSVVGAVTRLRDIGIDDYLLASTVRGVVAQRLLRRVCHICGQHDQPEPTCRSCQGTGYSGRIAVNETLVIDKAIADLVSKGAGENEIARAAHRSHMSTLAENAARLVSGGITTDREVRRVLELKGP